MMSSSRTAVMSVAPGRWRYTRNSQATEWTRSTTSRASTAGKFGSIILNQIGARPYFLLILTPGTLNRCVEPTDWVRREIEEAVATSRVIIPLHTTAFDFDDLVSFLPGGVGEAVGRFNAQELSQRYFKVAVERLVQEFLLPVSTATVALEGPEQAVLDAMQRAAAATPAVTAVHLSAQEYFEQRGCSPCH